MRFPLATLLGLFVAASMGAQSIVDRPISTPVYGPAAGDQALPVAASNGTDFLFAWVDYRAQPGSIYATRVSSSGQILDRTGIRVPLPDGAANVGITGVFWIGGAYAVIFGCDVFPGPDTSTQVVRIDSEGNIIDGPRRILDGVRVLPRAAASNGSRILLAYSSLAVLDSTAHVITRNVPLRMTGYNWTVASNGSTFLIFGGFSFASVGIDGELTNLSAARAPMIGEGPIITSDGTDYIAIYKNAQNRNSFAQRLTADAEQMELHTIPLPFLTLVGGAVWTGTSYLLAVADYSEEQKIVGLRLDRFGEAIDTAPFPLGTPGTPGVQNIATVVSNGGQIALAWTRGSQSEPSGFDVTTELLDLKGSPQSAPATIESANSQRTPAIATRGAEDFVVWVESDGVYGARVSQGRALDGRGIRISEDVTRSARVAYDDSDQTYVVAWIDSTSNLHTRRIAANTGSVLPQSSPLATCVTSFDIFGDDHGVLVAFSECRGTSSILRMGREGAMNGPYVFTPSPMSTTSMRITANSSGYLIAWTQLTSGTWIVQGPAYRESVYATRVSRSLMVLDVQPIAIALSNNESDYGVEPIASSDGTDFLIVWQNLYELNQRIHVRHLSADGVLLNGVASDTGVELEADGHVDSVVWDGQRYAIAFTRSLGWSHRVYMTHVGRNAGDPPPNDRIDLSVNAPDQSDAALLSRGNGKVSAVYARVATQPLYGGVMRIFERDPIPPPRVRAVRR